jgi:transcriptional regulator CtsR
MKGKKIIKKEIILVLSEREAELLKALIQNPLFDSEQPEVSELRRDLFESLTFEDCYEYF